MYRGTTPTLNLQLETDLPLDDLDEIWVTFKGVKGEVSKNLTSSSVDPTTKTITVTLTQEDTLSLVNGPASVQVRFKTTGGLAYASTVENINVERILKDGVI